MKTLGLLRHAKSDWDNVDTRDFDRGLNERGRRGARLMGRHIREDGRGWELLLASPAVRVVQTLAEAELGLEPRYDPRLYLASPGTLVEAVQDAGGTADRVLLSGHNPGLQELLFMLVGPEAENALFGEAATKYPTAAYAVFELAIDTWADLASGCGTLVHFMRPRDLDPALGPEE